MKKLMIVTLAFMLGSFSIASAELGVNLGVSGQIGAFMAQAQETEDATDQAKASAITAVGYTSVFFEKTLGSRLAIGIDYVPAALSSETSSDSRNDHKAALSANVQVTQKVQVDLCSAIHWPPSHVCFYWVCHHVHYSLGYFLLHLLRQHSRSRGDAPRPNPSWSCRWTPRPHAGPRDCQPVPSEGWQILRTRY